MSKNNYDPRDYRNPWEDAENGFWTIYKKDGCTSMRRLDTKEGTHELIAFHYAMAMAYKVMVETIFQIQERGEAYSISDLALKTIDAVGKFVLEEKQNVGN